MDVDGPSHPKVIILYLISIDFEQLSQQDRFLNSTFFLTFGAINVYIHMAKYMINFARKKNVPNLNTTKNVIFHVQKVAPDKVITV